MLGQAGPIVKSLSILKFSFLQMPGKTLNLMIVCPTMSDLLDVMEDEDAIRAHLAELRREHQDLDDEIDSALHGGGPIDFMRLQRLKKRKLALKDVISKLESQLLPDIIA